jgi:molybdopterin guanine dinucleotide-containing S/N-oxide reductase-like protein
MGQIERLTNGTTGGPVFVYVRDGRIIRITPIELDASDAPSWVINARGRKFSPQRKTTLAPYSLAWRSLVYSPKRLLYPLKRVDFDPGGKRNCAKRGESEYERISWDEAADIVTSEIKRIKRDYGPAAILSTPGSHHLWGNIGYRHSTYFRFMDLIGYSYADHNPDSWEGWHWGGMHQWGFSWRLGIPEQYDLLEDALKNTEMIVFWSSDPEATSGIYAAFESTSRRMWLKELGVKMVFIDPFYNHTAGLYCDKWFSPRMGTGNAMACAIAYVWITENLYDKEYIKNRAVGFDKWKDYILGVEDGVPKTPEWAEQESAIPAREIRVLAREWASKKTMLAAGGLGGWGGACRAAGGGEWARLMISLASMQGMGKPGSNIWGTTQGVPCNTEFVFPGYAEGGISGDVDNSAAGFRWVYRMFNGQAPRSNINAPMGQHIPRLKIPECILDGKYEWRGKGFCGPSIQAQFHKYKYPADGYPEIQMYYRYGGSFIGTMNETNRYVKAYRTERLPFVVNQSVWMEGEAKFADILLPACTNFERWDISEFANCSGYIPDSYTQCNHRVITLQKKCIEPLGESKSDYDIFTFLSKKLGLYEVYTDGGLTDLDWVKRMFDASDLPKYISWDDFFKKGYFIVPLPADYKPTPALRWFAEGRKVDTPDWGAPGSTSSEQQEFGKGLQTNSGLIEFESSSLKKFDPSDEERPLLPKYIPSWEGHHTTKLYKQYPLQLVSPHPRFSFHTMGDAKDSFMNDVKDHRVLIDGHYYWIIRINTKDAEKRGIKEHDLVKVFNDRGAVICAAQVTERVPPGTVHSYESSADYDPLGEPGNSAERGGCINQLTPGRYISKNACGQAPNSCLVQIKKWGGEKSIK